MLVFLGKSLHSIFICIHVCANNVISHVNQMLKLRVCPVVSVAVEPKNPAQLPRLVEDLKCLAKCDSMVQCTVSETGQHIVASEFMYTRER